MSEQKYVNKKKLKENYNGLVSQVESLKCINTNNICGFDIIRTSFTRNNRTELIIIKPKFLDFISKTLMSEICKNENLVSFTFLDNKEIELFYILGGN